MGKSLVSQFLEDCVGSATEAIAMNGIIGLLEEYHYWLKCHFEEFKEEIGPFAIQEKTIGSIRPAVFSFASLMENKLRKHDKGRGPRGWMDGSFTCVDCFGRLQDEMSELYHAIKNGTDKEIRSEAVDVGNFAMMIADLTNMEKI